MKEKTSGLLSKAARSIEAAEGLLKDGHADFAADRAYYALFHVAQALLAERGLRFRSRGAVHGAYGMELAKTQCLDPRFHRLLLDAFDKRQLAVYELEAELRKRDVRTTLEGAREFLAKAREYLKESS